MQIRELGIPDSYVMTPRQFGDDRGVFLEWYRFDVLEDTIGHALDLRQANLSVSRRGVLRGVHFAAVPRGQAKVVTAMNGAVMDYVVDLRVGSETFGNWSAVRLDDIERRVVYVAEGLGHAFVALSENATVAYLTSDVYRPEREYAIDPRDPDIGLDIPEEAGAVLLSDKDHRAPSLAEAKAAGILPTIGDVRAWYEELDRK